MLIDWFTVFAQVLNFLILVWLLKRFLYKPILNAIDAREKRIAEELADAATKTADAQKERQAFQEKNATFDRERDDLLKKMRSEVDAERQRLLDDVRQSAEALRAKHEDSLNREYLRLNDEILRRTQDEVFAIAQKTLTDLAETSLEARVCSVFVRRLRALDSSQKESFAKALKTARDPVRVRSAFELPDEQRTTIQDALNETFATDVQIQFQTEPDIISGIELIVNGEKFAWSIADYLTSFGNRVREFLEEQHQAQTKASDANESEATEQKAEGA